MVYISYNTGARALPDIYALVLGCCVPLGIMHIYQAKYSCLCYNLYIYCFDTLDQRDSVLDKSHIAHLSVLYKK